MLPNVNRMLVVLVCKTVLQTFVPNFKVDIKEAEFHALVIFQFVIF